MAFPAATNAETDVVRTPTREVTTVRDEPTIQAPSPAEPFDVVAMIAEQLRRDGQTVSCVGGAFDTPRGAMPQVRYRIDGGDPVSMSDAWVVGTLVDVEPGRSFRWTYDAENDRDTMHVLEYGAPGADLSTVHLVMRLDRALTAPDVNARVRHWLQEGATVRIGLNVGPSVDLPDDPQLPHDVRLGAILHRDGFASSYDDAVWGITTNCDESYLGPIDGGVVTFPDVRPDSDHLVADLEADQDSDPIPLTRDPNTGVVTDD